MSTTPAQTYVPSKTLQTDYPVSPSPNCPRTEAAMANLVSDTSSSTMIRTPAPAHVDFDPLLFSDALVLTQLGTDTSRE